MSSARYAPIPSANETSNAAEREMEDAFDGSDDEDNVEPETQPMISRPNPPNVTTPGHNSRGSVYNFDYDFPPPGSPPSPTARALPNNIFQNSNGYIPDDPVIPRFPRQNWFSRTLGQIWPRQTAGNVNAPRHVVGNGLNNDGVFANVVAKPKIPVQTSNRAEEGTSNVHIVPEFEDKDAPPSYAAAQADAVPPYWDNSVFAPSTGDELLVEGFPPGTVFSFVTNFFVSVSFQFVGFMLTSVLATSHAAKFGSRAGLGFTLIQYGFYLRGKEGNSELGIAETITWPTPTSGPRPTFSSVAEIDSWIASNGAAVSGIPDDIPSLSTGDYSTPADVVAATDWLSFFLMTVGWLLFLASLLGYWRVKRFERSLRQSSQSEAFMSQNEHPVVPMNIPRLLRLSRPFDNVHPSTPHSAAPPLDPAAQRRFEAIIEEDRRLQIELREAGLL